MRFLADMGVSQRLSPGSESTGTIRSISKRKAHNTRTTHVIVRLATVLAGAADALQQGAVVIVEETRRRIRHLPIRADQS